MNRFLIDSNLAIPSKLLDALCIVSSLWLICLIYERPWSVLSLAAFSAVLLFWFCGDLAKLYRSQHGGALRKAPAIIAGVWLATIFLLLILAYISKISADYSRLVIGTWFFVVPILLYLWRFFAHMLLEYSRVQGGFDTKKVAILGATENGANIARTIQNSPEMGLQLTGIYDDRIPSQDQNRLHWAENINGKFGDAFQSAYQNEVDIVYIALPLEASKRINELLDKFSDTTVSTYLVPQPILAELMHYKWADIGGIPVIGIFETPFYGLNGWLKRLEDIILAGLILLIIAIPMLCIAVGIKLSSPGPVFYKQKRYGMDGDKFGMYKFRSMRVCENDAEVVQATKSDSRTTRFGSFLRRTSLDELPQFINVLQGHMSVVGPRPHAVAHNEQYRTLVKRYMSRHKVKPGITGWAQINGWRGETDQLHKMEQRIKYDLWYINNWSFWLDVKIILLTLIKGFISKNAY